MLKNIQMGQAKAFFLSSVQSKWNTIILYIPQLFAKLSKSWKENIFLEHKGWNLMLLLLFKLDLLKKSQVFAITTTTSKSFRFHTVAKSKQNLCKIVKDCSIFVCAVIGIDNRDLKCFSFKSSQECEPQLLRNFEPDKFFVVPKLMSSYF